MEKNYKRVPFNIELAKKIQSGEIEGRIVTDRAQVISRVLCYDKKAFNDGHIVALVDCNQMEYVGMFSNDGRCFDREAYGIGNLLIELPKETPKHEFKPFDKVLVRNKSDERWHPSSYATTDGLLYYTIDCKNWQQCIPYEGNQELVGTTDKPKEE